MLKISADQMYTLTRNIFFKRVERFILDNCKKENLRDLARDHQTLQAMWTPAWDSAVKLNEHDCAVFLVMLGVCKCEGIELHSVNEMASEVGAREVSSRIFSRNAAIFVSRTSTIQLVAKREMRMTNMGFGRAAPPTSVQPCKSECKLNKEGDDKLSAAAGARIESLTRTKVQRTGFLPTDNSPAPVDHMSGCEKRAHELGPVLRRFNRYREAIPYANACLDVNKLGDEPKPPKTEEPRQPKAKCLTRLPVNAVALCRELGLPAGSIKDEHLRDDSTGFRALMYRDESTGKLILVGRDTQPTSLVDWQTNTRNGDGRDTDQYASMRKLAKRLSKNGVQFDMAGYSKGGGLAQEAGLINRSSQVFVFNSAGLPLESLNRTGNTGFGDLTSRTVAFSVEQDFLTYMNETTAPEQQIANVQF